MRGLISKLTTLKYYPRPLRRNVFFLNKQVFWSSGPMLSDYRLGNRSFDTLSLTHRHTHGHIRTHTYPHTWTYTWTLTHTDRYPHTPGHTHVHTQTHIPTYVDTHMYTHGRTCTPTYLPLSTPLRLLWRERDTNLCLDMSV